MKSKLILNYSTSFAVLFMATSLIGSAYQSNENQENSIDFEPTVVSTSPSDGDINIARNIVIEVTFSEAIDSTLMENFTFTLMQGTEAVEGTLKYSGDKGMFTANRSLKAESEYTASISTNNNQSDNDHSGEETYNEQPEEHISAENDMEWSFTTGGNSDPVETVDLGQASEYVILAQSSINNDQSSDITGESGFDPDFKKSEESNTAYWLNNEDVDQEKAVRVTDRNRRDHQERATDQSDSRSDEDMDEETADRVQDRNQPDYQERATDQSDTKSEKVNKALGDMITAYNDAADRSPVDFIDYNMTSTSEESEASSTDRDDLQDNEAGLDNYGLQEYEANSDHDDVSSERDDRYTDETNADVASNESSVTLEPGIYKWNQSVELSTHITLSGSSEDVWIFQIPEGLTVNRDVEITLGDGAVAEHVFWQVAGEVNLGESSHFEGIILSLSGITMKNGATINGRMLAQTDVTLDDNTITQPLLLTAIQQN